MTEYSGLPKQPPIDALNAPLPPTFAERARRRRTPLLFIFLGSAVLHALFLGFVMAKQSPPPPPERLMEIDLREPTPPQKPEKKVKKEKPKPLKIVKRVPPKTTRIQPKPEKPRKIAPPKPKPKITRIEKPLPPPKKSVPPKNPVSPVQPKVAVKPPEKPAPPVKPEVATKPSTPTKPRVAMLPKNPTKPDPLPSKPRELKRATQDKAAPPELPQSLRTGTLPKPLGDAGQSKGPGHAGNEAAPGNLGEKSAMKPKAPTRMAHGSSPFDEPSTNHPATGGKGNGEETLLPRGERTGRLAAGLNSSDPTFDRSSSNHRPGGGSAGATFGSSGNGSPRSRNDDLAGIDGAGGARAASAMAKAGGRPRPGSNIMAYHDPTNRDRDRVVVGPGAFGPGRTGGSGTGDRRGGAGRDDGQFNRSALNTRPGNGLGDGKGGDIGDSPRRGRGDDEMAGGGGGNGGGMGSGNGKGVGAGNDGGGGGGRRGPRVAGNLFGDPNGSKGGDARGGGKGGGPGGPGNGTRIARRGSGGGSGNGKGDGPSFGRGNGSGAGAGLGAGENGKGTGDKGVRDGRGDRPGDMAGDAGGGKGSGARRPGMASASREREGEDIIGRGVWGSWMVKFYQDKSDHPDIPDASFGPGHAIDWPLFTDLKATKKYKTLDFNWGNEPPAGGMKSTFWSARITGKIFVPKDDDYWFYFDQLDDAGRLVLNGKEVIKVWKVQKSTPDSGKIHLKRGEHDILIEYVQGPAVEASLTLSWKSSSFPKEVVGIYQPGEKSE